MWILQAGLVFVFATLAWVFFRAQSLSDGIYVFAHFLDGISSPVSYLRDGFTDMGMGHLAFISCCLFNLFPLAAYDFVSIHSGRDTAEIISEKNRYLQWALYLALGCMIVFFAPKGVAAEFVYFQF